MAGNVILNREIISDCITTEHYFSGMKLLYIDPAGDSSVHMAFDNPNGLGDTLDIAAVVGPGGEPHLKFYTRASSFGFSEPSTLRYLRKVRERIAQLTADDLVALDQAEPWSNARMLSAQKTIELLAPTTTMQRISSILNLWKTTCLNSPPHSMTEQPLNNE